MNVNSNSINNNQGQLNNNPQENLTQLNNNPNQQEFINNPPENLPINNNSNQQQLNNNPTENLPMYNDSNQHQFNNNPTENLTQINNNAPPRYENFPNNNNNFQRQNNIFPPMDNFGNQNNPINNFGPFPYNSYHPINRNVYNPPQYSNYQNPNMNSQSPWIFRNGTITFNEQTGFYSDQSGIYDDLNLNINPQSNFSQYPPPLPIIPPDPQLGPSLPYHRPNGHFPRQNNNNILPSNVPSNPFAHINRHNQRNRNRMIPHFIPPAPIIHNFNRQRLDKNEKLIESLEEVEITEEILSKIKTKECNICLDEYKVGDKISYLPCFHFFHYICIKKWIEKSKKCPLCNNVIKFE